MKLTPLKDKVMFCSILLCAGLVLSLCTAQIHAQQWKALRELQGGRAIHEAFDQSSTALQQRQFLRLEDSVIYALGGLRLYRSSDKALRWEYCGEGLPPGPYEMAKHDSTLYVSCFGNQSASFWYSADGGQHWQKPQLQNFPAGSGVSTIFDIACTDAYVYALVRNDVNTRGGIVVTRSSDHGNHWEEVAVVTAKETRDDASIFPRPALLSSSQRVVWYYDATSVVSFHEKDGSKQFVGGIGVLDQTTKGALIGSQLFLVSNAQKLKLFRYQLQDDISAAKLTTLFDSTEFVTGIVRRNTQLFARVFLPNRLLYNNTVFLRSLDSGKSWQEIKLEGMRAELRRSIPMLFADGTIITATTDHIFKCTDGGYTFLRAEDGYRNFGGDGSYIAQSGAALCVSDPYQLGFYSSIDAGATWLTGLSKAVQDKRHLISVLPQNCFATSTGLVFFDGREIYTSDDGARIWKQLDVSAVESEHFKYYTLLHSYNGTCWFYAQYDSMSLKSRRYFSVDSSGTVKAWNVSIPNKATENMMTVRGNIMYSMNAAHSYQYSSDGGLSWTPVVCADTSVKLDFQAFSAAALASTDSMHFLCCAAKIKDQQNEQHIFRLRADTLDLVKGLESWTVDMTIGDFMNFRHKVFSLDQKLCFASSKGIFQSDDSGMSFHKISTPGMPSELGVSAATVTPTQVYCLVSGMGIYVRDLSTGVWHTEEPSDSELQCQPQPCFETCTITLPTDQKLVSFSLSTVSGLNCTVQSTFTNQQLALDLRNLAAGCYSVQCRFESGLYLQTALLKVDR